MSRACLALTCSACGHPFTLAAAAYRKRLARYPDCLLCQRCIGNRWLAGRGHYLADRLLEEKSADADSAGCHTAWRSQAHPMTTRDGNAPGEKVAPAEASDLQGVSARS